MSFPLAAGASPLESVLKILTSRRGNAGFAIELRHE